MGGHFFSERLLASPAISEQRAIFSILTAEQKLPKISSFQSEPQRRASGLKPVSIDFSTQIFFVLFLLILRLFLFLFMYFDLLLFIKSEKCNDFFHRINIKLF